MCFSHVGIFFFLGPRVVSRARLGDTPGARPNTMAQVWALAEVRGTCSGGSKSQVNHGEAFLARRAMQAHANPRTGTG